MLTSQRLVYISRSGAIAVPWEEVLDVDFDLPGFGGGEIRVVGINQPVLRFWTMDPELLAWSMWACR